MGTVGSESTEPFGGFELAIRTFWLKVTELRIARKWQRKDVEDGAAKFDVGIGGKARSEDMVVIIGGTQSTSDFHFHLNADDPTESWTWTKEMDIDFDAQNESTPERKLKKRIYGELDKAPPTATLFWSDADWEIGIEEGWCVECTIPSEVRDQLVQDILAGKTNEVSIGIKWVGGLVRDKHVPPSVTTAWGLFRIEADRSPEPLHGQVESLTWELGLPHVRASRNAVHAE